MVVLGCVLDMVLLWVSAIIYIELMALSLGLGAPKITPCPLNVQRSLISASIFHISAVYAPVGLCFRYDAFVGLILFSFTPTIRFRGPRSH